MLPELIKKAYADKVAWPTSVSGGATPIGDYNILIKNIIVNIVNPVIALMVAVAVIYFLWGVFQFVKNAESSEERKKGGMNMLWGVMGFFIMVAAYGIINLIMGTISGK